MDAITALVRQAYAKWVPLIGREPLPMGADYEDAVAHHCIDLLERDLELVGLIETMIQDGQLTVINVAVLPGWQGKGFGRVLLAHAETITLQSGLQRIALYTNVKFEANIALYTSLGYQIEREETMNGGTAIHMAKVLRG